MKKESFLVVLGFIVITFLASCSSLKDFPAYDQVLIYDRPYDYTFLRTIEALNTFRDWTIEETDKNKGFHGSKNGDQNKGRQKSSHQTPHGGCSRNPAGIRSNLIHF